MKLPLKHPLTFGKTTITHLTFRDYTTAGDYLAFDQRGGVAQRHALIASLTGTDESVVRNLRGPDYRAAEKIADDMIQADEDEAAAEAKAKAEEGGAPTEKKS